MTELQARKGDWMNLASGKQWFPFDPRLDDVDITDIAHALAQINRYAGAPRFPYSVAQHCVLIARWLREQGEPPIAQMCGLLHDAMEALTGFNDVIGPVKGEVPVVSSQEDFIWRNVIAPKFHLPVEMPAIVGIADKRIRSDERDQVMPRSEVPWNEGVEPLGIEITEWYWQGARAAFLMEFDIISDDIAAEVFAAQTQEA